jgi:hypothetical protein
MRLRPLVLAVAFALACGPACVAPHPAHAQDDDGAWQYGEPPPGPADEGDDGYGAPPDAQYDDAPDAEDWDQALAPHGDWVDTPDYGRAWHPWVASGWEPYVDGYWSWSPWGWLWVSYEPFGWTYHYGRWGFVPLYGWVWVPGTAWGPAWVDWYWGDGYVGWAPLPPFAAHVAVFDRFVFVREPFFCSRTLFTRVVRHRHVPSRIFQHWRHRDFRPPDRHRIERVSAHPVPRVDRRPLQTLAPGRRHGDFARPGARGPGRGDDRGRGRLDAGRGRPERRTLQSGVVPRRPDARERAPLRPADPGRSRPPVPGGQRLSPGELRRPPSVFPGGGPIERGPGERGGVRGGRGGRPATGFVRPPGSTFGGPVTGLRGGAPGGVSPGGRAPVGGGRSMGGPAGGAPTGGGMRGGGHGGHGPGPGDGGFGR